MGYRLSKIITRTGDSGQTGLGDGSRVSKAGLRMNAIGDVDELNACIGILQTHSLPENVFSQMQSIQNHLFDLGSELAVPGYHVITDRHIDWLEDFAEHLMESLKPLNDFILPGGCPAAASCHLARTVCRRAERQIVALAETEAVSESARKYLNRLSDVLFVLARYLNQNAGVSDVLWQKQDL